MYILDLAVIVCYTVYMHVVYRYGVLWGARRGQRYIELAHLRTDGLGCLTGTTTTACERVPVETACKKLSPVKSSMYLQFPLLSSLLMHLIFSWCVGYVWFPNMAMV